MVSTRLPFGKHKGQRICDVPTSYLGWLLRECHSLDWWLRSAIEHEVRHRTNRERQPDPEPSRGGAHPPVDWSGIIRTWYRDLVMRYHPDRAGPDSTRLMQAINDAHERLKKMVGV